MMRARCESMACGLLALSYSWSKGGEVIPFSLSGLETPKTK